MEAEKRQHPIEYIHFVSSEKGAHAKVQERIKDFLIDERVELRNISRLQLATEEAIVNAMKHGHRFDPNKEVVVSFGRKEDGKIFVQVKDQGEGFERSAVPDPTAVENLDKDSGRGLGIMETYTDVAYEDKGRTVILTYPKEPNAANHSASGSGNPAA